MGKKKGSTRAEILEMQYTQPKMVKVYGVTGKPKMVVEQPSQRDLDIASTEASIRRGLGDVAAGRINADTTG